MKASPAAVPSTATTGVAPHARPPPRPRQHGAFGAQRYCQEAVASCHAFPARIRFTTVRSASTATGRAGAALRQKTPSHFSHAASTAAFGISSWQRTASCSGSVTCPRSRSRQARRRSASRRRRRRGSARRPSARPTLELERDAGLPQPRERFVGLGVSTDRADHGHLRAEPGARDGLIRTLPAREAREAWLR